MSRKTFSLQDSFGKAARFDPRDLAYIAAWDNGQVNFFTSRGVPMLFFTPDTFAENMDFILGRLKKSGVDLIRLGSNLERFGTSKPAYQFFFTPDAIPQYSNYKDLDGKPALVIDEVPFYLDEDEFADFRHVLLSRTGQEDWLEFSTEQETPCRSEQGVFGYRRSQIIMMFAIPDENILAIETRDNFRSFVPMNQAHAHIAQIARTLPQLRRETIYPMTPLFADPAYFNGRRLKEALMMTGRALSGFLRQLRMND